MIKEGGFYVGKSKSFDRGILPNLSRTITTLGDNAVYVAGGGMSEIKLKQIAQIKSKGFTETTGRVYDPEGLSPTIQTLQGGNREPKIVAMRGRYAAVLTPKRTEYGKSVRRDYENGAIKEQRKNMQMLEPRGDGLTNTITTVQKDNLVFEPQKAVIRKLTPRECFRLMGFTDADFDKVKTAAGGGHKR